MLVVGYAVCRIFSAFCEVGNLPKNTQLFENSIRKRVDDYLHCNFAFGRLLTWAGTGTRLYQTALLLDEHFSGGDEIVRGERIEIDAARDGFTKLVSAIPIRCTAPTVIHASILMSQR